MPSPFPYSPMIRERSWKKNPHRKKKRLISEKVWLTFSSHSFLLAFLSPCYFDGKFLQGYERERCSANLPLYKRLDDSFIIFYEFNYCGIPLIEHHLLQTYYNFIPSLTLTIIHDN